MSADPEMADLLRQAEIERRLLADAVGSVRDEFDNRRREWRMAGLAAGALYGIGSMAYKVFSKSSPFARIGRAGTVASVVLGLIRAANRWRKFF